MLLSLLLLSCMILTGERCGAQDASILPRTLAVFHLDEFFHVGWPDQPIEFRYDGGPPSVSSTRMMGPNGKEVPYQWVASCSDASAVKGCILVRSELPANARYTWTLQGGVPPAANSINAVKVTEYSSGYQITNGLTGVRIAGLSANPKPWNLAPIQGVRLPNGAWTGVGSAPNLLYTETDKNGFAGDVAAPLTTPAYSITGYSVTFADRGPMKTVLKAIYTFNRPRYVYPPLTINTPGAGHYTIFVTIYANSKSILIDEDSDTQFSYYLPLYAQIHLDRARYRGHNSPDPLCGYEIASPVAEAANSSPVEITTPYAVANGQRVAIRGVQGNLAANGSYFAKTTGYPKGHFGVYADPNLTQPVAGSGAYAAAGTVEPAYRGSTISPVSDAYQDITYTGDRPASYTCGAKTYRKLLTNYPPASPMAGWYVMAYDSTAGASAPVVGFYVGRASQQFYSAKGPSLPGLYSSNHHWISGGRDAGIQVDNLLRGADGSTTTRVHRNWAIWVSRQSDLLPTSAHQPIADDQNALTGINLSHIYTYQLIYPDPPGGWKWLYLTHNSAAQLVHAIRNGTSVCGTPDCFSKLMWDSEPSPAGRTLNAMWKENSTAGVQKALDAAAALAGRISWNLSHGSNHFDRPAYYELGLSTIPQTAVLNAILMDDNATPAQKTLAKAALALFGCLFWDNDWFPVDNPSGDGAGLANQVQQYLQYRAQSVAAAPSQPFLASKLPQAIEYAKDDFKRYFSPTGAAAASTHYQSAFFEPLILNYLSFSLSGALSMSDPKWAAYAQWELSIQTPPEPRFGNLRKGYSNGDGNTEGDVRTGMLATALYSTNPALAANLMWAWQQNNSATIVTEDQQFVTTLVAIDNIIPRVAPVLTSINIPGYHSAERHSFATPYETALWFINGGFYSTGGHRHYDDGQISIYALSAPLAIDWNANLYSPHTDGRFAHDSIVFDNELRHPWSADNPPFNDVETLLDKPTNTEFAAFPDSTTSTATFTFPDGTVWTRTARTMAFNPKYPIVYVYDSFSGPGAGAGKTLTWNLMATGAVSTPVGRVTPAGRFSQGCQSVPGQLPSSGPVRALSGGLQKFSFTGARWPRHATGGIDWDLFTVPASASAQFTLGNWGHGCQDSRESGEFQAANGAPFSEAQDILRIHDQGPFTTMILPYRKTEVPTRTVTRQACGTQIAQGSEMSCFNNSAATYANGATNILTVYDNSTQAAFGLTVGGGPQEVAAQTGQVTWIISGARPGVKNLTLPGNWTADKSVPHNGDVYTYTWAGGLQAAPVTIVFRRVP